MHNDIHCVALSVLEKIWELPESPMLGKHEMSSCSQWTVLQPLWIITEGFVAIVEKIFVTHSERNLQILYQSCVQLHLLSCMAKG